MKHNIGKSFEILFNVKASKIEKLLRDYRLNDLLVAPGIIPGITIEQHEMIGTLNKWTRTITSENFSYKKETDPKETARYLYSLIGGRKTEILVALLYNRNDELIKSARLAEGGISSTQICYQALSRTAVEYGATSLIIAHNHPSGNPELSVDDIKTWTALEKSLKTIDVDLSDCFVIGDGIFCSKDHFSPTRFNKYASEKIVLDVPQKRHDMQYKESLNQRLADYANLEKSAVSDIALKIAERALDEIPAQRNSISGLCDAADEAERVISHTGADSGVLFLNTRHQVIGYKTTKIPKTACQHKILAAKALQHNASAAIMFRRELQSVPEGTPLISNNDCTAFSSSEKHLKNAGITLLDSIVLIQKDDRFEYQSANSKSTGTVFLSQPPQISSRKNRK